MDAPDDDGVDTASVEAAREAREQAVQRFLHRSDLRVRRDFEVQRERSVNIKLKIKKNIFWKLNQYDPEN